MHIIGLRNIKTAIAVFITLMFKLVLVLLIGEEQAFVWYTPFFAAIAAAYSMHKDVQSSLRQAKIRSLGSIIGGLYGIVIVLLVEECLLPLFGGEFLNNHLAVWAISYTIYSVAIIGAIFLAVKARQAPAVFITCLTYLSVTVSIRNGGQPVVFFGLNRILSTIFGVFVAVGVNMIKFPKRKNKNILFISTLDNNLLNKQQLFSGFIQYKLNSLVTQGAKITFATTRTPSSVNQIFDGINLKLPIIIMNGAAIFDLSNHHYSNIQYIPKMVSNNIDDYFKEKNIGCFTYTIIDDNLTIYVNNLDNPAEKLFYKEHKNSYFSNYVISDVPKNEEVNYYVVVNTLDKILEIINDFKDLCGTEIIMNYYPFEEMEGYYLLKIQDNEASKVDAINALNLKDSASMTVAFGFEKYDIPMLKNADLGDCFDNSPEEVKKVCGIIIKKNNPDYVFNVMDKLYHGRNINKKIAKLKEND